MVRDNLKKEVNKEIADIINKYISIVKENYDVTTEFHKYIIENKDEK